jgi:YVTN family beta-propeller protein
MQPIAIKVVACAWIALAAALAGCAHDREPSYGPPVRTNAVGRVAAGRYLTPTGQVLTPAGQQIELPGMRPQALALSPDGRLLAVAGKAALLMLLDPSDGRTLQKVPLSLIRTQAITPPRTAIPPTVATSLKAGTNAPPAAAATVTNRAEMSLTGLAFSPDGRHIYLSNAGGNLWAFPVDDYHQAGKPAVLSLPAAKGKDHEIPAGLAVSPDGWRLYVVGNLGNRLYELEAATGRLLRSWDTGVAPYDVVLAGAKAYVSNLGGRRPAKGDLTAPAGKETTVRVDRVRHIPDEGSVTVVDLVAGRVKCEILVGLHASALAAAPGGDYVVVANSGSDTLSVIDTRSDRVVEKVWTRQTPADLFGAQPNALAFDPSGRRLYVCNGTQNAVAVIRFDPKAGASCVVGLVPVGWFPGAIGFDPWRRRLLVANIKGIGAARVFKPADKVRLNSHDSFGTVSMVPLPAAWRLRPWTAMALRNMRYPRLAAAMLPPRPGQPARPVPERAGEPSVFKHVIYVIKENRSYDQVLGDMTEGNGDASLCIFGEAFTPNQHKLAREFVLMDNAYCAGMCSADGHQWTDSALANEYVERQLTSGSPRSYTGGKGQDAVDALAWASSGFLWDNALGHGRSFRNYGEWMISEAGWKDGKRKDKITWRDFWRDFQTGAGATQLRSRAGLGGLRHCSDTNTVGWDLKVPDVQRAAQFIGDLRRFETNGGFPDLVLLFLPNDHTGGTRGDYPTPGAQIADNDLALGRLVEALSHSRFWADTCLFAIEDDPQAGWDHVSGYRTTCYVASPYTKRRQTISTPYNQAGLVRTIELILGLPPMNQMDAAASPLGDCFTPTPDFTPFLAVANRVPLDRINPDPKKVADRQLRLDAIASNRLPLDAPDRCPEDVLNRILWRAMNGPQTPYPEWAVKPARDDD